MTRGSVFLATVLLAASLGATAKNNEASAPQNNSAQRNVTVQTTSGSPLTTNAFAAHDSRNSAATIDSNVKLQTVAQSEGPAAPANGQLPQTSTILPLLGLIGLGSLVAGFFARR